MTSKIKVNTITTESGSTLTVGESGKTVALASGASQTGFGRAGSVNWDTTAKTAGFTGVSGNGYFINTTGGAITVNLPASPSAGDIMAVADYAGTADTNAITIGRNGSNINGAASNLDVTKENSAIILVYVDATQGWKNTETSNLEDIALQPTFIVACGGTETESGNFKIHTFTGPGTFTVSSLANAVGGPNTVDYLVIAGGAGGGGGSGGAGGGAGGYRESSGAASGCYTRSPLGACVSALPVAVQGYPITVGGGGALMTTSSNQGGAGVNSVFSTITSAGGGGGGGETTPQKPGVAGGSGGGAQGNPGNSPGGAGNTPPVSPPQGNPGGNGVANYSGGGGGGATGTGGTGPNPAGAGGAGATSSINGTPTARAGGGGGGNQNPAGTSPGPASAGGGAGGVHNVQLGQPGTANTGGGGGGGAFVDSAPGGFPQRSGAGGSGIVIIRYKFK